MRRRLFLQAGAGLTFSSRLWADMNHEKINAANEILEQSVESGMIDAAVIYVRHQDTVVTHALGKADSEDAIFLLASISKPIAIAAVMSLYEQGLFDLNDSVGKFIPEFRGDGRDSITIGHLMTHRSGLPDQLPENSGLRSRHAPLSEFVQGAIGTPLLFLPGSKYSYSSMGILLATEIAQRIGGKPIATLVNDVVYRPLQMNHSALGIGQLKRESLMRCQVEKAAAESGAGDPTAGSWDWNSDYWRGLGAPWGGAHGSAPDVARFLDAFLHPQGQLLKPETARLMVTNHNPPGMRSRGLGFDLGKELVGSRVSNATFGHGGSTGTICWADPGSDSICVVLTTLPAQAIQPHPRDLVSRRVAEAFS